MFDVLVWIYRTYSHFDACPEPPELMQTLSDAGFRDGEISEALGWLYALETIIEDFSDASWLQASSSGMRIYTEEEQLVLGHEATGFIRYLEHAGIIGPFEREVIIETAFSARESLPPEKFRILVLMVLWSDGRNPAFPESDMIFFNNEKFFQLPH